MKELIKFTVKDGDKDLEFSFMEPSKAVLKEAEVVNSITFAECVRSGYLTAKEVSKIYSERDGIFTKAESDDFQKSLEQYLLKDKDLKDDSIKYESDEGRKKAEFELATLKDKVLYYYNQQDAIFEKTAERKAREVTLVHYALALIYHNGKAWFEGVNFKSRQKHFDDNPTALKEEVIKRGVWYATAYISGVKFEEVPYPETVSKTPVAQ